jgi:hypothetical protein
MKMPSLVITKHSGSIPIRDKCSSCREVKFSTEGKVGTAVEHLNALHEEFKLHFEDVHMREDASQAAARIVRESTRDK